jgi:hypothetical protein
LKESRCFQVDELIQSIRPLQQQIDHPVAGGCGIVQLCWPLYRKSGHWLSKHVKSVSAPCGESNFG